MTHRRKPWGLYLGLAAAVFPAAVALTCVPRPVWAALVSLAAAVARAYLLVSMHVWDAVLIALAAAAARAVWAAWKFTRLPRAAKRNYPRACWARLRWTWLARNTGLSYVDQHRRALRPVLAGTGIPARRGKPPRERIRCPHARFTATERGFDAAIRTVPGVGRAELEEASVSLADQWKAARVAVTTVSPGLLAVRAFRVDPLLEVFGTGEVPPGIYSGRDLSRLYVGRDEHGQHRWMQVRDNTAATVAGLPGSGKSVGINGLLLQWAPSPAAQFGTADGKSPVDGGDYEAWRRRAWRTCSDDREAVADMLSDACAVMRERLGRVEELTGSRNGWHAGPTPDFPLFAIILDEAQRFLDLTALKRDRDAEGLVLQMQKMAGDIVRQGRSAMMFLIVATQKATTDSLPSQIRDNAALSLALAQKTRAASKAALGDDVADYEAYMPTTLQGPEYVGCAIATLRTGDIPFTRLRMPAVGHAELDAAARRYAHLRRDPAVLLPEAVPADAVALASADTSLTTPVTLAPASTEVKW